MLRLDLQLQAREFPELELSHISDFTLQRDQPTSHVGRLATSDVPRPCRGSSKAGPSERLQSASWRESALSVHACATGLTSEH